MPTQIMFAIIYGSIVLVVAAIVVGVVVTRGSVRMLLVAALVVTVLRYLLTYFFPAWVPDTVGRFASTVVQWSLVVAEPLLLVGAAVVGARTIKAKDAALAALTRETPKTWRQPEPSPDPRLPAD